MCVCLIEFCNTCESLQLQFDYFNIIWYVLFLYQEEAVKKARARSVGTNFRLSSQARHQRAVREFRQKIRREEEEARLASKVGT